MTLTLAGRLPVAPGSRLTIRGRTGNRQPVTLLDCICSSHTPGWSALYGSWDAQEYRVGVVLLGGRSRAGLETRYRCSSADFSGLPEFTSYRPFGVLRESTEGMRETVGIEQVRETRVQHEDVDITVSVDTAASWHPTLATLKTRTRLDFRSRRPRTIDDWHRDYHWPIATLISLALGRACIVSRLAVLVSASPRTYERDGGRVAVPAPWVTVLRGEPLAGPPGSRAGSVLFTLADDVALEDMLPRWLDAHRVLRLPLDLYFSTVFAPFMYLESRFLNLVQAAEGYHRVRYPDRKAEDPLIHAERLTSIYGSTDNPEHRAWLEKKLGNHSNEPTLRRRLLDLAQLARRQGLKMNAKEADGFALSVKNARDELSHGGIGERRTPHGDYVKMERQLTSVLQACWLCELGVSIDASTKMLNRWV
jgi:hypothetical protein